MAISNNKVDRIRSAYKENATDGGTDQRTCDVTTHDKLDSVINNGSLLAGIAWDYVSATYPLTTTEVYEFKTGGSGGTTVATITIVYTTAAKTDLSTVTRTTP